MTNEIWLLIRKRELRKQMSVFGAVLEVGGK